jgi:hypothetical protein
MEQMNITSAQYVLRHGEYVAINIIADENRLSVPLDPANRHYAEIMRQVEAGELVIQDADS